MNRRSWRHEHGRRHRPSREDPRRRPRRPARVARGARHPATRPGARRRRRGVPRSSPNSSTRASTCLFVWGGDGTVQACHRRGRRRPPSALAIMPAGTANLLARNLGIPPDLEAAAGLGLSGGRRKLDLGAVNGERFCVMAGVGFDALMIRDADAGLKDKPGTAGLRGDRHRRRPSRRRADARRRQTERPGSRDRPRVCSSATWAVSSAVSPRSPTRAPRTACWTSASSPPTARWTGLARWAPTLAGDAGLVALRGDDHGRPLSTCASAKPSPTSSTARPGRRRSTSTSRAARRQSPSARLTSKEESMSTAEPDSRDAEAGPVTTRRTTLARVGRRRLIADALGRLRFSDGFSHARSMAFLGILLFVEGVIAAVGISQGPGQRRPQSARSRAALQSVVPGPAGQRPHAGVQPGTPGGLVRTLAGDRVRHHRRR